MTTNEDTDLDVLRSIRDNVNADPAMLARLRAQVVSQRRAPLWPTALAAGVGALAIGVAAALLIPPASPGAPVPVTESPSQSHVSTVSEFTAAAAHATVLHALKPKGTQWVKVTLTNEWTNYTNVLNGKITKTDHLYSLTRITESVYVPSSKTQPWVRVLESRDIPISSDAKRICAHSSCHAVDDPQRARDGAFGDPHFATTQWVPPRTALAGLTADPVALADKARSELPAPLRADPAAQLGWFADKLASTWVADADLRAAMFTAVGTIDGVQLRHDVTIDGQQGVALVAKGTHVQGEYQLVFDPDSYRLIGWRITGAGEKTQTLYNTELVDSAP